MLQTEMGATQRSLVALVRLGLGSGAAATRPVDQTLVLELTEMLVRRAMPAACRHTLTQLHQAGDGRRAPGVLAAVGRDAENLSLTDEGVAVWEDLVALARSCGEEWHALGGNEAGPPTELAPRARVWQAYLIMTLLAVVNPATLGKVLWSR
jgi:hypothetical protein